MLVCPDCGRSDKFEIIANVTLHLQQAKDGTFVVDLDFMKEMCPDLPFAFTGNVTKNSIELKISDEYKYVDRFKDKDSDVLCMSDECDGKEFRIKDLLLTQDERVMERNW